MTDDFKRFTLQYLVGKIYKETDPVNEAIFKKISSVTNNLDSQIVSEIGTMYTIRGMLQSTVADITIIYGDDDISTFFVLLDEEFNVLQIITTYDNGNQLDLFKAINVADDGTFYGVTDEKYFVMLSNFTVKLNTQEYYSINKRYSYSLSSANYGEIAGIKKSPQSATYVLYGNTTYTYSSKSYKKVAACILIVSVSDGNKIINYTTTSSTTGTSIIAKDVSLFESDDSFTFTVQSLSTTVSSTKPTYVEWSGVKNEEKTTIPMTLGRNIEILGYEASNVVLKSVGKKTYIGYNELRNAKYRVAYIDDTSADYAENILEISSSSGASNTGGFQLIEQDNIVYFLLNAESSTGFNTYIGLANGSSVWYSQFDDVTTESLLFVNKTFNLSNFYIQNDDVAQRGQTVYNVFNYNGKGYQDINCLVPNSAILYDENDIMLFARNLYNKSASANTTISTLEIPNTYLNYKYIEKEELDSETNIPLNKANDVLIKNIYESVHINFINTLRIKNSNDPQNEILNTTGATRLNLSISTLNDYVEAKLAKFRLLYSDGTSKVQSIQNIILTSTCATIKLFVYIKKEIDKIQLISQDELTVYQEIDGSDFEAGKYYNISQNVEIN